MLGFHLLHSKKRLSLAAAVALGWGSSAMMAQSNPPSNAPPPPPGRADAPNDASPSAMPPKQATRTIHGIVQGFNLTPHGTVAGVLVKTDGGLVQLNTPPDMGSDLKQALAAGDAIDAQGVAAGGKADHPVYELSSIQGPKGAKLTIAAPWNVRLVHVEATITQLNFSREGRVDGAQLDNGDLAHLGPAAGALQLAPGQKLTVDGYGWPMSGGHQAIEAIQVNGELIRRPPPPGGPGAEGPKGRGRPASPPSDNPGSPPSPPQR